MAVFTLSLAHLTAAWGWQPDRSGRWAALPGM